MLCTMVCLCWALGDVAVGVIYAMGAIASFFRSWAFTLAGQRLVARVRTILFESIVSQEVAFFDVTRTGELTNRLASDTQVIQNACTVNLSMLARYTVQIFGSIAIMLGVSWRLTLVLLSVVPAVAIGAVAYGRKVKVIRKEFQDRLADASTVRISTRRSPGTRTSNSLAQSLAPLSSPSNAPCPPRPVHCGAPVGSLARASLRSPSLPRRPPRRTSHRFGP